MQRLHNRTSFLGFALAGDSASEDSLSFSVDVGSESAVSSSALARFCFGLDAPRFMAAGAWPPARPHLPRFAGGCSESCTPGNLHLEAR